LLDLREQGALDALSRAVVVAGVGPGIHAGHVLALGDELAGGGGLIGG
jgi:hypothetical protein